MTNIILIILISINFILTTININKALKNIQKRKQKIKEMQNNLNIKKLALYQIMPIFTKYDLKSKMFAKFKQEDIEKLNKIVDNIQKENTQIYIFSIKLLENIDINNLRNFIHNIPTTIINYHKSSNTFPIAGTYDRKNNTIEIYRDKNNITLYHELLHASSASYIYNAIGFKTQINGITIGKGLNEGYTELLNNRLFNTKSKSYLYLQKLAKLIEKFYLDKEEMVEDYFNADLLRLFGELLKSMSIEEAVDIIVELDQFTEPETLDYISYLKTKQKIKKIYNKSKIKTLSR